MTDQTRGRTPDAEQAEPEDKDWEWRRKIRSNPHSHRIYKWVVGIVGTIVTVVGLIAVPAPGPGWLIVFVGVGILASEFEWAQRLLDWGKARLADWNDWLAPKPWWFKGLVGLMTLALVALVFYGLFLISGIPGFVPDVIQHRLTRLPGL
ncbi:TIGR02611 family protein [Pedococcus sp. KACC 23699]|uniref:TIGR02611 family protein n=1 Tax=Pedococcus sp. KACC 23699 TaxID=3149228 RepID=A0AAU7JTA0_9MICO